MSIWKPSFGPLALGAALLLSASCAQGLVSDLGTDQVTQGLDCVGGASLGPAVLRSPSSRLQTYGDAGTGGPLLWHCGEVLGPSRVQAIFWGSAWTDGNDPVPGMDQFFQGFGGSAYAHLVDEYTGLGPKGPLRASDEVDYSGHWMDPAALPDHDLSSTEVVSEVCRLTQDAPLPNTIYAVFSSRAPDDSRVCGWHSSGTCASGAPVLVLQVPNLSLTRADECDPMDDLTGHSVFLSKLANVTAHELEETLTDPTHHGWIDSAGDENGDKCSWVFEAPVTFPTGTQWKLQMEWSNAAYRAGTGAANRSGLNGCVQGS